MLDHAKGKRSNRPKTLKQDFNPYRRVSSFLTMVQRRIIHSLCASYETLGVAFNRLADLGAEVYNDPNDAASWMSGLFRQNRTCGPA